MTDRQAFHEMIPQIAEMIVECRKMSKGDYEDWKRAVMDECPEKAKDFFRKALVVVDTLVKHSESNREVIETKGGESA